MTVKIDTFTVRPIAKRRHRKCRCAVACPTFRCRGVRHVGKRAVPWCVGSSDEGATTLCAADALALEDAS